MNIYDFLQEIITPDKTHLMAGFFENEKSKELSEEEQQIFSLLKNIASIWVKYKKDAVEYSPNFVFADGRRTYSIEDLTDADFLLLQSLDMGQLPTLLKLRIADILWTEKKQYKMALLSIESCHELYFKLIDNTRWEDCFGFLEHAIGLAAKINAKQFTEYMQEVYDKIIKLNGEDPSFFSIRLIDLLLSQRWQNFNLIPEALDNIIAKSDNVYKIHQAYELKSKILFKMGKSAEAVANNLSFARYLESKAKSLNDDGVQNVFRSEQYLQEAIHLFRNNGAPEDGKHAHEELLKVQKKIPQLMIPISSTVDASQEYQKLREQFEGLSFEESIIWLIQCTPLCQKSDLKQKVLTDAANPIACLFGCCIKSSYGQTVAELPPLDITNPESNTEVLELYMHQTAQMQEEIHGGTVSKWALDFIRVTYSINPEDLQFLVRNNPIIPAGRERIFQSGLYLGLTGELYSALHILAPQVENLFRTIAQDVGAVMSTLNSDNTSDSKLLSSIFDAPELIDCYNNDILFMFKGMMHEKVGANIRNEIAHGLMGEQKGNSGVARFFFCWVIKLLAFTSKKCAQIYSNSQALQKLKQSNNDFNY